MRKGTKHSEETKAKIAAAKAGKTFTPEHSAAISAALKGQKKSAAHRKAIGEGIKAAFIDGIREAIDKRIRAVIPGDEGSIASALITGKRDAISTPINDAMYISSLAHVLSI